MSNSNTYNLIYNHEYWAVLIEGDKRRYQALLRNYEGCERVTALNCYVDWGMNSLDRVLARTPIPPDFDLLSLDIDGNDYHVWASLECYRPKLVLIEYNPTMRNSVWFVQPRHSSCSQGSSPRALVELGKRKRYELIAATELNLLFVDEQYFPRFNIPDNSLELVRDDSRCPWISILYDGTVLIGEGDKPGYVGLPWHGGVKLSQPRVQAMPRVLRRPLASLGLWRGGLYFAWLAPRNAAVAWDLLAKWLGRRLRVKWVDGANS